MKRLAASLLAVAALTGLAACGEPVDGTVVGHEHRPATTTWVWHTHYSTRCTGTGTRRTCSSYPSGSSMDPVYIPAVWTLKVRQDSGEHVGEVVYVDVNRRTYDQHGDGSHYDNGKR